jgi:hypothetical protein
VTAQGQALGRPQWRGESGRIDTWYATFTDPDSGAGYWIHAETWASTDGQATGHGWFAAFPVDAEPLVERFGPEDLDGPAAAPHWFHTAACEIGPGRIAGATRRTRWEIAYADDTPPVYTFPRLVWQRRLLPGQQIVPFPAATFSGTVEIDGQRTELRAARGGLARIFGHGHAQRWGWLHAELSSDGDLLEIVSAVSRRPGLRALPPLSFVQLRLAGRSWPPSPLAAAPLLRGRIGLPEWTVSGIVGRRRLRVRVIIPPERAVALDYHDPDGSPATCTNTERADAEIVLQRWAGRWRTEHTWTLGGTAHAEVGLRAG